jgi:hypothetical protein
MNAMKRLKILLFLLTFPLFILNCNQPSGNSDEPKMEGWRNEFNKELSLFGHRNWILIVDKAFPAQTATGIITIETGEDLLDALSYTLQQIESSTHVKPVVYKDKELGFIDHEQVKGIDSFRKYLDETIGKYNPQVMLHDSVFVKIDEASKLFKILVLKTNETIPYSSVFIELDCKYWSGEKENILRDNMAH